VADEEPPDQLSRRAKRRAAREVEDEQGEPEGEALPGSELATSSAELRKDRPQKKKTGAKESTQSIREEARRQRDMAAQRRKSKRSKERRVAVAQGLDAGEMVDDALARATHRTTQWIKRNFAILQWVIVGGLALGIGWSIYDLRQSRSEERATDDLMAGVRDEFGKLATDDVAELSMGRDDGPTDPRPEFESDARRLEKAREGYRETMTGHPAWDGAVLAEIGLAGVLYDSGKYAEALEKYRAVRDTEAARKDFDLRARAIEGIGMSQEALKQDEAALKTYQELENFDVAAYRPLGSYHKARILKRQGKKEQATELAKKAFEKLSKAASQGPTRSFVLQAVRDMLQELDPAGLAEVERMALQKQLEALTKAQSEAGQQPAPGMNAPEGAEQLRNVLKGLDQSAPEQAPETPEPAPGGTPEPAPGPSEAPSP
jgi:tetratricopeptide (TPR) repeat protein